MCINIICAVDVDKKILLFVRFGLNYIDIVFGSVRELYYLLLFDIVSFPICIFVFVWSEKRPQNIVWSVLVTKKSTFAQAWMDSYINSYLSNLADTDIFGQISYSKKLAVCVYVCSLIRLQVNLPCVTSNTQKT